MSDLFTIDDEIEKIYNKRCPFCKAPDVRVRTFKTIHNEGSKSKIINYKLTCGRCGMDVFGTAKLSVDPFLCSDPIMEESSENTENKNSVADILLGGASSVFDIIDEVNGGPSYHNQKMDDFM